MRYFELAFFALSMTVSSNAFASPGRNHNLLPSAFHSHKTLSTIRGGDLSLNLGLGEAWTAYNEALEANPLIVKSVTAGLILGAADLAGQALERSRMDEPKEEGDAIDVARAVRFAIFGLVLQAPWNHFYYMLLDGAIPPTEDPFTPTNIAKVGIDQFIQAPIFTVLIFVFLGALEGKGLEKIKGQLENDYKDTIVANCK